MPRQLRDSVIVITGASAGIGRALATVLHEHGARLVLAARRIDRLESLNSSLGGKHLCVQVDVSRTQDCHELIENAIEHFGRIDTLVCNAGYGIAASVAATTPEQLHAIFATNVFGTTDCIAAAVPYLRGNEVRDCWRGQIMIVSSAAARRSLVYFGAYSATKSAQLSIAESLRVELSRDRIAVTTVHPITTRTDFFDNASEQSGVKVDLAERSPVSQTAELVAAKMVRAMEKPCRELWPYWLARPMLSAVTFLPSVGDWVMGRMKRQMDRAAK
ncbi:MAG: SDR family NAD(P)-dependent oxidoreductase [Tepidisphaeraceae bacterium]